MLRLLAMIVITLTASGQALAADAESAPGTRIVESQCAKDLHALDQEVARIGFGSSPSAGAPVSYSAWASVATPRQKMRAWRNAARLYALEGACLRAFPRIDAEVLS